MKSKTIAVDLAKNVFESGISDRPGQMTKTYRLSRGKFLSFFANQELATVVMEACSAAHHWGREIQKLGHTVVLISPQYVRPYVARSKTDRADVKGLLEAHRNADIRAVPIKTVAQQQLTALHRIRSTWMADPDGAHQHGAGAAGRVWACAADGSPAAGAGSHGVDRRCGC